MRRFQILLGVLALCAAVCASAGDVKTVDHEQSSCQCKRIVGSLCAAHYGLDVWYARFPNAREQDILGAVTEFAHFQQLLQLDNYCSHMLYNLLCFHYFPKCDPQRPRLGAAPCRETCNEAVTACIEQARVRDPDFVFPDHLNCNNFPSGQRNCDFDQIEQVTCNTQCSACPNASIHLEFATEVGRTQFNSSECSGSVPIGLRLANVGSYNNTDTLKKNVTVLITTTPTRNRYIGQAEAGVDYVPLHGKVVFPVGSRKGSIISTEIEIHCDDIDEANEYFEVVANITSPFDAKFGGDANSRIGRIQVEIRNEDRPTPTPEPSDRPTPNPEPSDHPTPNPEPSIPQNECRNTDCKWRTGRINRNTFRNNNYTFAARVQVLECRASILVVNMLECHNISCGVCPETPSQVKLAICTNCHTTECPTNAERIVGGGHTDTGSLYIADYKKKGLFAPVRSNWKDFLPTECVP